VVRNLKEFMKLAQTEGFTQEQAAAAVQEEVDDMRASLGYDEARARAIVLTNIGYFAGYYPHDVADRVYDLYQTEHPIWGREHPTPSEIFQWGIERGKRSLLDDEDRNPNPTRKT
jgi:hypothetical protein